METYNLKGTLWRSRNYSRDFIRINDIISRDNISYEIMYTSIDGITYDKSNSTRSLKNTAELSEFFQNLYQVDLEEFKKTIGNTSNKLQELCSDFVSSISESTYNETKQAFIEKVKKLEGKTFRYKHDHNISLLICTINSKEIENNKLNNTIYFDRFIVGIVTKETTEKVFEKLSIYTDCLENGNKYIYEQYNDSMSYEFFINNFEECTHYEFEKCVTETNKLVLENYKTFYK